MEGHSLQSFPLNPPYGGLTYAVGTHYVEVVTIALRLTSLMLS